MESELKYELDTLRQTESELQQGRNRINEIRTMVQSETISVGMNSKLSLRMSWLEELYKTQDIFEFTKRKFNKRSRNEDIKIKCRIIFAGIKFKDWSTRNYSAFDALIQTNIQCTCPRTGSYIPLYLNWLWAGKTLEFRLLKTQFIIWTKLLVVIQSTVILFWDLLEYLPENRLD